VDFFTGVIGSEGEEPQSVLKSSLKIFVQIFLLTLSAFAGVLTTEQREQQIEQVESRLDSIQSEDYITDQLLMEKARLQSKLILLGVDLSVLHIFPYQRLYVSYMTSKAAAQAEKKQDRRRDRSENQTQEAQPLPKEPASPVLLPSVENHPALVVVFDLDETLIYNQRARKSSEGELQLPAVLRPHAKELLEALRKNPGIELVLWTASVEEIARTAMLETSINEYFHHVIVRHPGWFPQDQRYFNHFGYTKDLSLLGRDAGRVVIVENSIGSVRGQSNQAIIVQDFMAQDMQDKTMLALKSIITEMVDSVEGGKRSVQEVIGSMGSRGILTPRKKELSAEWQQHIDQNPEHGLGVHQLPPHGTFFHVNEALFAVLRAPESENPPSAAE
jgi:HAD superfamily phosphatase (TIGR01681 family)